MDEEEEEEEENGAAISRCEGEGFFFISGFFKVFISLFCLFLCLSRSLDFQIGKMIFVPCKK